MDDVPPLVPPPAHTMESEPQHRTHHQPNHSTANNNHSHTINSSKSNVHKESENLWATVLSEVQTNRNAQLPSSKNLLVLGDKESGKTTLIAKLQGNEDPKKGAGLEYSYIDVRDEYRDDMTNEEYLEYWLLPPWDHTRLGVWTLDGDTSHVNLLKFALTESNFTDTSVVICVSMMAPWNIMDQLQNWASLLQDHIDKLSLSAERTLELQNENRRIWQSYVEPGDDTEATSSSPTKRISRNLEFEPEEDLLPLPENTLTRNLGLDLIVVVTKTDYMSDLERDYDYKEEHFDFIQQSIRKFCLQFGAALFYTSVKDDKNCDVFYKYLVHRIYGFPFKTPALVVEKDAVFIPAGWDNEKKIAILFENMHSVKPDQYYTDVIARPIVRKPGAANRDIEVVAEDEQQFLLRQQQYLLQGGAPPPNLVGGGAGGAPAVQKTPDRKVIGSPGVQGSPKKMEPSKPGVVGPGGAPTSESVLSSFFNSLLSKKTGQGVPGQPGASIKSPAQADDSAAMRSDAAAELDRLTRSQKKVPLPSSGNSSLESSVNNTSDC
ncbi:cytoplasmic dynein 1 light intermediate chain 2-like isoform X2 [Tigriopus californicus]|uniref:cytoplasmic dynein 1 light intermediate chain 2-like isoform X2 n=1 Tax=Tigriopus californicus TaxID=6832 RepID=UPI0027DA3A44|nr:cytoplasmic dynein 1 light intermediate chain 2-like isoform X2 [Tigriopus californicus]